MLGDGDVCSRRTVEEDDVECGEAEATDEVETGSGGSLGR